MKSFFEFCDTRHFDRQVQEAAQLIVDLELDPIEWLIEWSKETPGLEDAFLADIVDARKALDDKLTEAGFMDTAKGVANTFGSALRSAGSQVKDYFVGPQARFSAAVNAITALNNTIKNNPQLAQMKSADGKTLWSAWLDRVRTDLLRQQGSLPTLNNQGAQSTYQQNAQQPQPAAPVTTQANPPVVNPPVAGGFTGM
jgi:hypothetical protein